MPRTAQAHSRTRERLLDAAQQHMLAQGFAATTVDEICQTAKLTKGSFFHYFESKNDLGRQLLERFCAVGTALHASCCGDEQDPLKRVFNYVDGIARLARDPAMREGCLLGTFAQELCDTHPDIQARCARGFDEWAGQFSRELASAKAAYVPHAAFDPRSVAEHLIAVMEGALIVAKAKRDPRIIQRNLAHFRAYLKSLFGR